MRRLALLTMLAFGVACTPASAAAGLTTGFTDQAAFFGGSPADAATSFARARDEGASIVRVVLSWRGIARSSPPDVATAADPRWSGYDWTATDRAVRAVDAARLRPLALLGTAPAWAEGPGRPPVSDAAPAGSWRPDPVQLRAFATAAARRYSGAFPDPSNPAAMLPRVADWQAWNEPNLTNYLTPQWVKSGGGYRAESPVIYRGLLDAVYDGIKAVSRDSVVVTAGTAPFGDLHPGERRIPPAYFWRALLCVRGRSAPKATSCPQTVRFDAVAHHPYSVAPPSRPARNADDVSVSDLPKITRVVAAAVRAGTVRPKTRKPLWITELSWDSRPDPRGLSLAGQARYLLSAFDILWHAGARVIVWYLLRDEAPKPSYDTTYQAGIFRRGETVDEDVAKPAATAFRFPFVAVRARGSVRLWGMAPRAGNVQIQVRRGGRWVLTTTLRANAGRIFSGRARLARGSVLRAVSAGDASLRWQVP